MNISLIFIWEGNQAARSESSYMQLGESHTEAYWDQELIVFSSVSTKLIQITF